MKVDIASISLQHIMREAHTRSLLNIIEVVRRQCTVSRHCRFACGVVGRSVRNVPLSVVGL